jgi:hypothetical protein
LNAALSREAPLGASWHGRTRLRSYRKRNPVSMGNLLVVAARPRHRT